MQIETKHRILGVLVVVGLVIILLPFFQSGKELSPESTVAKAPAFPDQSVQVTATSDMQDPVNQQPDDIISVIHPSIVTNKPSTDVEPVAEIKKEEKLANKEKDTHLTKTVKEHDAAIASSKRISPNAKSQFESSLQASIEDDGLAKLNDAAWVIQIGSFKNKTNALRLVNQLRAKGYRAFIQQVSTTLGTSTRVFVGPETKRALAHSLATRLEKDMHVQGVVISYQPLALS